VPDDLLVSSARTPLVDQRDTMAKLEALAAEEASSPASTASRSVPRAGRSGTGQGQVHHLKVTLTGTKPPVWRRLLVPSNASLADLHVVLQTAFDWFDGHLHDFDVSGHRYAPGEDPLDGWWPSFGPPSTDEATVTLADIAGEDDTFTYTYDFGDDWRHRIEVEAVEPAGERRYPACIGGRRAAPPEDIGGPPGYQHFLMAMADPGRPEHEEYSEWLGGGFDPTDFDPEEVDALLGDLRFDRRH
jgi:hypothetical protein